MIRRNIFSRIFRRLEVFRHRAHFAASVRHLHGPRQLDVAPHDVVLIALVRDGTFYLDAFFEYYRAIGVKHFVFFDNGSTDGTIERIKAEPGTIIDQSTLPLGEYEWMFRQYPANTYGRDCWCLYVDMDEIFDFEGRAALGIQGLTRYLEQEGATAFLSQMLEMFPDAPLKDVAEMPFADVLEAFRHYDISALTRYAYHSHDIPFWELLTSNSLMDEDAKFLFGGVRGKVFNETCCLTKHPLIFNGPGVDPGLHPHLSSGVRVADVSGVIKHYKFTNNPQMRDGVSQKVGGYMHGEDSARLNVLEKQPDLSLWSDDAQLFQGVEPLYRDNFLLRSDRFSAFVSEQAA